MPEKILNRNFVLLSIGAFLASVALFMLMAILPIFAVSVVGLDKSHAGIVVAAFALTALVLRPFIGYALDNYNKRVIMLVAMAFFMVALLSYPYISTLFVLIIVRMIHGTSWATLNTANYTIVPDLIPKKKRGEGIGYFSMAMPLAMVFGPAVSLEMFRQNNNFNLIFGVAILLGLAAALMFLLVKVPTDKTPKQRQQLKLYPSALYEKRVVGISFIQLCFTFVWSGVIVFLPLYALSYDLDGSLFFTVYALGAILTRIFAGKTFDKYGPSPLIYIGSGLSVVGLFCLSFTPSYEVFFISGFFVGVGTGLVFPSLNAMLMNVVEPSARGKANATLFTSMDLGMGVGAMISGGIIGLTSYSTFYMISAAILCMPAVFYALYEKKHYQQCVNKIQESGVL